MHPQTGSAEQIGRRVAARLPTLPDLHHELSGFGELEDLAVLWHRVANNPHKTFRVDVKAVLVLRPFVRTLRCRGPSPPLDEIAALIEFEHGRRSHRPQVFRQRSRPMEHPHVAFRIHGHG